MLLVHRSSNCCKDIPRNLRSTSVSKGSVIHSRRVILALFAIPLPGRDPDLGLDPSRVGGGGSSLDLGLVGPGSMPLDLARRLAASLLLAVA